MSNIQSSVLISDAEREQALARLREACVEGRLTLEEFSDRTETVLAARGWVEVGPLVADLAVAAPPRTRREPLRRIIAVMGSNKQRARWRVAEGATAVAFMGECELDLRTAEVPAEEIEITACAVMGTVKVIVPEGVDVEVSGVAFMGRKESAVAKVRLLPGAPLIRVRAYAICGEVKVESRS